jgi:hypothetical protein
MLYIYTPSGIRSQNYNNKQLTRVFDKSMIGDKTKRTSLLSDVKVPDMQG